MLPFILRRILVSIPLLLVLVAIVFVILRTVVPGDPAQILAGERATPELVEQIRKEQGLDKPLPEQFAIFLWHLAQGDLGRSSMTRQPVTERLLQALPFTLKLTATTFLYSTLLGILVGVITAYWQDTWIDNLLRLVSVFGASMPTFWIGLMLMLVFAVWLGWLPVQGDTSLRGLVLPTLTLGTGSAAGLGRLTRAAMLEVLRSDYIRTARSKGQTERRVVLVHGLRNALIPIITIAGFEIGGLLGGAVITETIFGLPGLGMLSINSIRNRDYALLQGSVLFSCSVYLIVNLIVDIVYGYADPRIHLK